MWIMQQLRPQISLGNNVRLIKVIKIIFNTHTHTDVHKGVHRQVSNLCCLAEVEASREGGEEVCAMRRNLARRLHFVAAENLHSNNINYAQKCQRQCFILSIKSV